MLLTNRSKSVLFRTTVMFLAWVICTSTLSSSAWAQAKQAPPKAAAPKGAAPKVAVPKVGPAKAAAPKVQRQGPFRRLAPGVLTTIPVFRDAYETSTVKALHDLNKLTLADKNLRRIAKTQPPSSHIRIKFPSASFHRGIWNLEFTFKPLRMIKVDLPQESGKLRTKLIWYMVYYVRNPGGHLMPIEDPKHRVFNPFDYEQYDTKSVYKIKIVDELGPDKPYFKERAPGVNFHPFFLLVNREAKFKKAGEKIYFQDKIIPLAVPYIRLREDPRRKLLTTAEIGHVRIKFGETVWGVVTWEDVDPRIDFFSIFIQGLSNAYDWKETRQSYALVDRPQKPSDWPAFGRKLNYKTLQLNFWRPGDEYYETEDEIRYGGYEEVDYLWIYK